MFKPLQNTREHQSPLFHLHQYWYWRALYCTVPVSTVGEAQKAPKLLNDKQTTC